MSRISEIQALHSSGWKVGRKRERERERERERDGAAWKVLLPTYVTL